MKKISIIIPTFNSKKYLERCIESLLKQSYKNIEIIIIDDGSNDGTEELINKKYLNNVQYIKQHNLGVSAARNKGIEIATGDYIFFIDADDTIDMDVLIGLINNFKDETLIGINHCICTKSKKNKNIYPQSIYLKNEFIEDVLNGKILGVVWGYLFDSSIVKKIKFDTNTSYLEDMIFIIEYLNASKIKSVSYINNNNFYNYYLNENSVTSSSKNIVKKCKDFIYSLDIVNEITNNEYEELIENKKIILLEKEMRLCRKIEDYKIICKEIQIDKYSNNNKLIEVFEILYKNNNFILLKIYYLIRKIVKGIKKIMKR